MFKIKPNIVFKFLRFTFYPGWWNILYWLLRFYLKHFEKMDKTDIKNLPLKLRQMRYMHFNEHTDEFEKINKNEIYPY